MPTDKPRTLSFRLGAGHITVPCTGPDIVEVRELRHNYDALTPVDMAAYRRRCAEIRTLDERADRAREV